MKHRVFVFLHRRPIGGIREMDCEVVTTPARTWVLVRGNRRLLGSTAFYTRQAAERAKRGAIGRMINKAGSYWRRSMPAAYDHMVHDIAHYDRLGYFDSTRTMQ